jgi:hypothetical protein
MKAALSLNVESWTLNVERFLLGAIRYLAFSLLGLILLSSWSGRAYAHPVAQGALEIDIFPDKIHARARVSNEEVFVQNVLSSREENGRLSRDEMYRRHGDYLLQHIHVFADGNRFQGISPISPHRAQPAYNSPFMISNSHCRRRQRNCA